MDLLSRMFGSPMPSLSAQELSEKLKGDKQPMVVDVREPEEYQDGHIAQAKLIPLGELNLHLAELPKDQEIVCVCASGSRSSVATRHLLGAGYQAINMDGGMYYWQHAGLPVKAGMVA